MVLQLRGRCVLTAAVMMAAITCAAGAGQPDDAPRSAVDKRQAPAEGDYADRSSDGSYAFRYADRNQFHSAAASKDNVVSGRFGSRSPETGLIVQTSYSAGPRGFRARGPDIARQTDLSQIRLPYSPPIPTDSSKYDPAYDRYHDPNEDPSYKFAVRTPTHSKSETADSRGHVEGAYSYLDDVGKRHDVQYEAGAGTGFHIKSAHPDSDTFRGVFYSGPPGKPGGRPRGHSSVVLGKDGSYGFTASGPDQRRSEVSDSSGRVQGSYTYVDDKGVQRTVQYVAGPEIGYRVVNNAAAGGAAAIAAVSVPTLLPGGNVVSLPPALLIPSSSTPLSPAAFEQDLFGPAASSTPAAPLHQQSDRRRPKPIQSSISIGGGGADGVVGGGASDGFLSPDSTLPLGSAFPEDDPSLPPKKWPTVYKTKDEESFFQSFDKFNKRWEQQHQKQQHDPKKGFAVPDSSSSSYGAQPTLRPSTSRPAVTDSSSYDYHSSSTSRPTVPDTVYGQPARPIVVDEKYGQYGGTDYQKPSKDHSEYSGHEDHGFNRFPAGTIVKAHVHSLDILPFGYRVPSPSYVFEKQFGNDYQNAIKK